MDVDGSEREGKVSDRMEGEGRVERWGGGVRID